MTQILVIEDDPTQRMLTVAVLLSAGYKVAEAADGAEGLQMAMQSVPDLVVCDVMMPGLNGYQVVDALKKTPSLATVPVILLTAMAQRTQMRVGMVSGADDYLLKPFRATELRQSVTAVLAKRSLQQEAFLRASESDLNAALQQQKDTLTKSYEKRLLQELDARWTDHADQNADITFDSATMLSVNIFSLTLDYFALNPPKGGVGAALRRVYEAASDSLYLFGAKHLVAAGSELLAVFPSIDKSGLLNCSIRAARSAFGVQKIMVTVMDSIMRASTAPLAGLPLLAIALHSGPVQLIQIKDALHGGDTLTLASGQAVKSLQALSTQALASGWPVVASRTLVAQLGAAVVTGQSYPLPGDITRAAGVTSQALEVVELLSVDMLRPCPITSA